MVHVTVKELTLNGSEFIGKEVLIKGWVRTTRDVKACVFVEVNDGSIIKNVQVVANNDTDVYNVANSLNLGSAIIVKGVVAQSPNGKQNEIVATEIVLEGDCPSDYPLQKKRHSVEYLRTIGHLRPRTNLFSAAFRIRSVAAFALHKFFNERGFIYCNSPIITTSDAEGAGAMFQATTLPMNNVPKTDKGEVNYKEDFFGKASYLTVSGQLEAEIFAQAFAKTYTFGPTFRAENSNTSRHAAEFWMVEPEIAFADLTDDMDLMEEMIKECVKYVLEQCGPELEFLNNFVEKGLIDRLTAVAEGDTFVRLTYTEAIEILQSVKDRFENQDIYWGCDLQSEHERYITEQHFKKPVFLINYPKEIKSFYMRLNDDGKTVAACDMLVPGIGELIGGSQREEREDVLRARMQELGLKEESYWWYLELRKYGSTKHAGFGIGFERFIMYLTGISNIRDVLPFPRTVGTADI
ncbi:MAG: asparagine--tRNA ligase [Clostridia bacterium]|nr:asparagine--tRNA ligase [Clostridia bacterium]